MKEDLVLIGSFACFALPFIWSVQALIVHAETSRQGPCEYTICYDGECSVRDVCAAEPLFDEAVASNECRRF